MRRRRILFAGFVAPIEDTRLPKCVMFGEVVRGTGCVGAQEKELSVSMPTSGRVQPRTRGNGARRRNKERNVAWRNGSLQRNSGWAAACTCIPKCDTKERIAYSKHVRAVRWRKHVSSGRYFFADDMLSFSGVTYRLFCFVFIFMLSLKPRLLCFPAQVPLHSTTP